MELICSYCHIKFCYVFNDTIWSTAQPFASFEFDVYICTKMKWLVFSAILRSLEFIHDQHRDPLRGALLQFRNVASFIHSKILQTRSQYQQNKKN